MIIKNPSIIEKLSLKYYIVLPHIYLFYKILDISHNAALTLLILRITIVLCNNILPRDKNNLAKEVSKDFNQNSIPHIIPLYMNIIASKMLEWWAFVNYHQIFPSLPQKLFGALILGSLTVPHFDTTHQLLHRDNKFHKVIAFLNMTTVLFTVYPIQHLTIHHKNVGTSQDFITCPKNKSVYAYYWDVIVGSYKANYDYSKTLFLICVGLHLGWLGFLYQYFGMEIMLFGILYGFASIFIIQTVQYIEHYGLTTRNSKQDRVTLNCAWNTDFPYSNYIIHCFQRHSDHHVNAHKIYNTMDLTTQMPYMGVEFMIAAGCGLTPSDWYEFANPLVDQLLQGKKIKQEDKKKMISKIYMKEYKSWIFFALVALFL